MIYRFGAFTLDSVTRRLTHAGTTVPLADRHLDVLLHLVAHPGEVVAKDALVQVAWPDVAVTDNSLEQAVSMIRKVIASEGGAAGATGTIDTVPRRGYRFVGEVRREASRHTDAELEALLAPHRAWLEGRAALESLSIQRVAGAERAFRSVVEASPDHASARVGLANALVFRFEATRIDEHPDVSALTAAVHEAREGCRLRPEWGEAWATLGFVLHRAGQGGGQSVKKVGIHDLTPSAAGSRAVELEPDNWRHHLRLAFICWGEARLRAAQRTLQLMPGLALAHWLAASVHVARQAFEPAHRELSAGTAAQDEQCEGAMFGGVGLHWLSGLLHLAQGNEADAERHFDRELAFEESGHLYARECCAATWYAKASRAFHGGDRRAATTAFREALTRVPRYPLAMACDEGASEQMFEDRLRTAEGRGAVVDAAVARAVRHVAHGQPAQPADILASLQQVPAGISGWYLPVEPMLRPLADPASWAATLALLRSRAG